MISELRAATVSVADLDRSCAFYQHAFAYTRLAEAEVCGREAELLWQMPSGLTGRTAVLGPEGATTGLLRLVEFDAPGEPYWGDYSRAQDYGHYALNIRVGDIRAAVARLREAGGRSKSEPSHWTVSADLSAWDSLSYDPDGNVLDVFQLEPAEGTPLADYDGRPSPLQTVAIHVSDARASADFYSALGYVQLYDKLVEDMESFFRLPPGTGLRNINLYSPDSPTTGRVELAQYVGFPGVQQRDRAVPPRLGILSVSLATDDLAAASALVTGLGGAPVCPAVALDLPPFGHVLARSFFGPDGEVLEFHQRR